MSSPYLNQLLFRENRINNSSDIALLEPYMLTYYNKDGIIQSVTKLEETKEKEVVAIKKEEPETEEATDKKDLIYVKQTDSLFWCLFIIAHGYKEYHMVGRNYGVRELEEKKKIYEFVKANPTRLKSTNYKMTNVAIQEIMSELMVVQKKTSYLCMIAILVYYNVNLLVVNPSEKSMIEFWVDKEEATKEKVDTFVLYKDNHTNYKLQIENIGVSTIQGMKEKMVSWEHFDKPMRGVSSYKVAELQELLQKLGLFVEGKKYKKEEMYELIVKAIV